MAYQKGQSGNPKGKPPGTKAKITPEVQQLARSIIERKEYMDRIKAQAVEGTLHPKIESMLWAYAYGTPKAEDSAGKSGLTVNLGFLQLPEPTEHKQIQPAIEVKVLNGCNYCGQAKCTCGAP